MLKTADSFNELYRTDDEGTEKCNRGEPVKIDKENCDNRFMENTRKYKFMTRNWIVVDTHVF